MGMEKRGRSKEGVITTKTMAKIKLNSILVYSVIAFNCGAWALAETEA